MRTIVSTAAMVAALAAAGTDRAARAAERETAKPPYATCTTFDQVLAANPHFELARVSDPGSREAPIYTGFFFYQCLQFDRTGRYLLGMRVYCQNRKVRPDDRGDVGVIDLKNGRQWTKIGETTAWNWQQGARLQWRPRSDEILWNDRAEDGKSYVCRVYNFRTGEKRTLPRPIYAPSPDGATALTHDFERMKHGGTDYVGIPDRFAGRHAPAETGIWRMDLDSGEATLIVSLDKMAGIAFPKGRPATGCLYFFREGWNPSGSRFMAFVKDPANGYDAAFSLTPDGRDIRRLYDRPSHHDWQDDRCVLEGRGYYFFDDDGSGAPKGRLFKSQQNGHVTRLPAPHDDWFVSDTYVVGGCQHLFLYHRPSQRFVPLAKLKSTAGSDIFRVDLHPRTSRDGRLLSIDATHEGLGRQMYLMDIGPILSDIPGARTDMEASGKIR